MWGVLGVDVRIRVLDATPDPAERMISPYLIVCDDGSAAIIDSGPQSAWQKVLGQIMAEDASLKAIVLTHIHLDHGGAAAGLAEETGAIIYVHPRGAPHVTDPSKLWRASKEFLGPYADYFGKPEEAPSNKVMAVPDGDVVKLPCATLRIIHTPGHASHHMSILVEGHNVLFTGDSAGVRVDTPEGPVEIPTNPPPFKPALYLNSLVKMAGLAPSRLALGHYGYHPGDPREYLKKHAETIINWLAIAAEYYKSKDFDIDGFKEYVIARIDDAARAAKSNDPVVEGFFLYGALAGMLDAIARGEEVPREYPQFV